MMARFRESEALPHDIEAEESVIGAILVDPAAIYRCQEAGLTPSDFWDHTLGWIYEAAERVAASGFSPDIVTISEELAATIALSDPQTGATQSRLDVIGADTLTAMISRVGFTSNVGYFANIVREHARRRRLIAAITQSASLCHRTDIDIPTLYDLVSQSLFSAMSQEADGSHLVGNDEAIERYRQLLHRRHEMLDNNPDAFVRTYWRKVDAMLGPLQPGYLVVIGARTSVGKTMAMEQIAEANAKRGHKVVFYHLELSHHTMLDRCVARYSGVPLWMLRTGYTGREVEDALNAISTWFGNITYVHCPGWTAERIAADITRLHASGRCDVAFVDYLQKIPASNTSAFTAKSVGLQVEAFKTCAEKTGITLFLGSQVSRFFKESTTKRPTMDDLRDSGEIAEKANVVIMLHRPENERENNDSPTEEVWVFVEKNTDGQTGSARLIHVRGRFLLGDPVEDDDEDSAPEQPWEEQPEPDEIDLAVDLPF